MIARECLTNNLLRPYRKQPKRRLSKEADRGVGGERANLTPRLQKKVELDTLAEAPCKSDELQRHELNIQTDGHNIGRCFDGTSSLNRGQQMLCDRDSWSIPDTKSYESHQIVRTNTQITNCVQD